MDALAKAPPPLRLTKEQRAEETLCDTDDEAFDSLAWLKAVKKPLGASRTSPPGDAPVYSAACPPPAAPLPFSCPVRLMPPAFSSACEFKGASLNAVSQHILDDHRDSSTSWMITVIPAVGLWSCRKVVNGPRGGVKTPDTTSTQPVLQSLTRPASLRH